MAFCKYYQSKDENRTEKVVRELRIAEGDYRDQTIDIEITLQNLVEQGCEDADYFLVENFPAGKR